MIIMDEFNKRNLQFYDLEEGEILDEEDERRILENFSNSVFNYLKDSLNYPDKLSEQNKVVKYSKSKHKNSSLAEYKGEYESHPYAKSGPKKSKYPSSESRKLRIKSKISKLSKSPTPSSMSSSACSCSCSSCSASSSSSSNSELPVPPPPSSSRLKDGYQHSKSSRKPSHERKELCYEKISSKIERVESSNRPPTKPIFKRRKSIDLRSPLERSLRNDRHLKRRESSARNIRKRSSAFVKKSTSPRKSSLSTVSYAAPSKLDIEFCDSKSDKSLLQEPAKAKLIPGSLGEMLLKKQMKGKIKKNSGDYLIQKALMKRKEKENENENLKCVFVDLCQDDDDEEEDDELILRIKALESAMRSRNTTPSLEARTAQSTSEVKINQASTQEINSLQDSSSERMEIETIVRQMEAIETLSVPPESWNDSTFKPFKINGKKICFDGFIAQNDSENESDHQENIETLNSEYWNKSQSEQTHISSNKIYEIFPKIIQSPSKENESILTQSSKLGLTEYLDQPGLKNIGLNEYLDLVEKDSFDRVSNKSDTLAKERCETASVDMDISNDSFDDVAPNIENRENSATEQIGTQCSKPDVNLTTIPIEWAYMMPPPSNPEHPENNLNSISDWCFNQNMYVQSMQDPMNETLSAWKMDTDNMTESYNNNYYPPTLQEDNKRDSDLKSVQNEYYLQCHQSNSEQTGELRDNHAEQYKSFMSIISHNNCQPLTSKKEHHRDLVKIHLEPSKSTTVTNNGKRRGRRKRRSSKRSASDETGEIPLNVSGDVTKSQSHNKNIIDDEDEDMLRAQLLNDMSLKNIHRTQEMVSLIGIQKEGKDKILSSGISKGISKKTTLKSSLAHKKAPFRDLRIDKEKKNKWLTDRKLLNVTITKKVSSDSNKELSQLRGFSMSKFPPVKPVIISLNNDSDSEAEHEETQKGNFKDCESVISGIDSLIRSCRNKQSLVSQKKDLDLASQRKISSRNFTLQRKFSSRNLISQRKDSSPNLTLQRKDLSLNLISQRKDSAPNLTLQRKHLSLNLISQRKDSAPNLTLQRKDLSLNLISQRKDSAANLTSQEKDSSLNLISHRKNSFPGLISQRKAPSSSQILSSQNTENLFQSRISQGVLSTSKISVRQPTKNGVMREQEVENQKPKQLILQKRKNLPVENKMQEVKNNISCGIIEHISIFKNLDYATNGEILCPQSNTDKCKIKIKSENYDKDCKIRDINELSNINSSKIPEVKDELKVKLSSCANEELKHGSGVPDLEVAEDKKLQEVKMEKENTNNASISSLLVLASSKVVDNVDHQDAAVNDVAQDMPEDVRILSGTNDVCISEKAIVSVLHDKDKEKKPPKAEVVNLSQDVEDASIYREVEHNIMPQESENVNRPQEFEDASMPQEFEDASRPQEFEEASMPQEFEDASRPQEFKDGSRPQEFEDASMPQEFKDASRPQEFEEASRPQEFEEASRPQEFEEASRPQEFEEASRLQEFEDVSMSQEVSSSLLKVECASVVEEVENANVLQEHEDDSIRQVSSEDSSDSESDSSSSSSSSSSSEDSESGSEDDEIELKEDETKIKKETEINLRNKLLQKREEFLQKENSLVLLEKNEKLSSVLLEKSNEDQECDSNSSDMLKLSTETIGSTDNIKITLVKNNNIENEKDSLSISKNIEYEIENMNNESINSENEPKCTKNKNKDIVLNSTHISVISPLIVDIRTADSYEVVVDDPQVEGNAVDNHTLRNPCKETESEVDKNNHLPFESNKGEILLMPGNVYTSPSSTLAPTEEQTLQTSTVLTDKRKETSSLDSFSRDISMKSGSSKSPKSVLNDQSSKCKDWKLQESQVEKSISQIFSKVQDELNNKVSSVKTLSSQILGLIQEAMTEELQCQNIFKDIRKLLSQITWLHKTRKEKKVSISSSFAKVTDMMQKLNSDVNYLSRLETVVQKQYNVQGVPLLSSIKKSKQVGEVQRQHCVSEMTKYKAAIQRLGSQEYVLSKTLPKSLDDVLQRKGTVSQKKRQPFKLDNRVFKRQMGNLENNSRMGVIRDDRSKASDCGGASEVSSVNSASCAKLIKFESSEVPVSSQKEDEPFANDKFADDLFLCPYGLLGRCNDDHCIYYHVSTADSQVSLPVHSSLKSKNNISDLRNLTKNSKSSFYANENIQELKTDNIKAGASNCESCGMEDGEVAVVTDNEVCAKNSLEVETVAIQETSKLNASQNSQDLTEDHPNAEFHWKTKRRRCKKRKSMDDLGGTLKKRSNDNDSCLSLMIKSDLTRNDFVNMRSSADCTTTTTDIKPIHDQILTSVTVSNVESTVSNVESNADTNASVCKASDDSESAVPSAATPRTRNKTNKTTASRSVPLSRRRFVKTNPSVLVRVLRSSRTKKNTRGIRR